MMQIGIEFAVMMGVPSVAALIVTLLARKYLCLVELCSPVYVGATSIVTLIINMTFYDEGIGADRFKA